MAFTDTLARTWRDNILFSALIELTYRCNLNCFFCYNDPHLRGTPLTTEQYVRFFEELRALGTLNLTLSGGEPLARADFFTLGRQARELGFLVRVKSNGHALSGRLARRLREEVDPFIVEVSLHGACPETHDRQTRVPGSFWKLLANLREMQALGLRIKLTSPLTAWNELEIEGMFALADDWGLPIQLDSQITPRDDGDPGPLQVAPSRDGVARLFGLQQQRAAARHTDQEPRPTDPTAKSTSRKHCGAGSATVAVDPFGNVYPCVQWRRRVGNLHEQSIQTIWRNSRELAEVRRLAVDIKQAADDYGTSGFGYCPGLAEQETDDPTRIYPAAQRLLELLRQIPGA